MTTINKTIEIAAADTWLTKSTWPILISGPCSAETEEQVLTTARAIAQRFPNNIFRAGIWKPRTRPGSFEGIGSIGLEWLKQVKAETGMRVATEIANAKHAEECLEAGIDILWIGARTTVNPFSVQEIADVLEGVDIPVMVKNPINPDLQLWIGAIERLNRAGINKIAAIHRGFSSLVPTAYRNTPLWKIAIELKRQLPQIPIVCDPSHIAGNTTLIKEVSQKALDLEMDGLMIETHCNPSKALSDAGQQLMPHDLIELIEGLIVRKQNSNSPDFENRLADLRKEIDRADHQLIEILAERMKTVVDIGKTKKEADLTILQINRWDEVLNERIKTAQNQGLNEEFIRKILTAIHEESIQIQTEILNK